MTDYYTQFLREKRTGRYAGCKYPNLVEIHGDMPTDYFADVTTELMLAVFRGEEDLTREEISKIARYNGIPLSVLTCPKVIMLDIGRIRHKKMINAVTMLYIQLMGMANDGNKDAEKYLEWDEWKYQRFMRAVNINRLSYGHYLCIRKRLKDDILFSTPKPKKRGITARKGGTSV